MFAAVSKTKANSYIAQGHYPAQGIVKVAQILSTIAIPIGASYTGCSMLILGAYIAA